MANSQSNVNTEDPRPGYWNWRVVNMDGWHAIHEVHYDASDNPVACTERPSFSSGATLEELREDVKAYCTALERPVLPYEMFGKGPLEAPV